MPEDYGIGYIWDPKSGEVPYARRKYPLYQGGTSPYMYDAYRRWLSTPVYGDASLTDPAVVTAEMPAKFNGDQKAAKRYAEGYRWGQENVVQPRERTAPYVAAGMAGAFAAPTVLDLVSAGASFASPVIKQSIPHVISVMSNPATANTTAGAMAATGAEAYGIAQSAHGLGKNAEDMINGNYSVNEIPETLLNGMIMIPGAGLLTDANNVSRAMNAAKDAAGTIKNIPNITNRSTVVNRLAHPVETYRFSGLARNAKEVLPDDIYEQMNIDLSNTIFSNRPSLKNGYSFFNRKPAYEKMSYVPEYSALGTVSPMKIRGLGDMSATDDWSRAHELGHLVRDSAWKRGYWYQNSPDIRYRYAGQNVLDNPDLVQDEYFADVFGNSITKDAVLTNLRDFNDRYPYFSADYPRFIPTPRPYQVKDLLRK